MRLIDADELQNVMDENIEIHKKLLAGEKNPDENIEMKYYRKTE